LAAISFFMGFGVGAVAEVVLAWVEVGEVGIEKRKS
jgi:hypothetical protein